MQMEKAKGWKAALQFTETYYAFARQTMPQS
jgi:hypothetical protein